MLTIFPDEWTVPERLEGVPRAGRFLVVGELARRYPNVLCVTATGGEAERLADDLGARLFPEVDPFASGCDPERLEVLADPTGIVVASRAAFEGPCGDPKALARLHLRPGQSLPVSLEEWGYTRCSRVTEPGQFSAHDLWAPGQPPCRLVDGEMREFDALTQRTVGTLAELHVRPLREPELTTSLAAIMPSGTLLVTFGESLAWEGPACEVVAEGKPWLEEVSLEELRDGEKLVVVSQAPRKVRLNRVFELREGFLSRGIRCPGVGSVIGDYELYGVTDAPRHRYETPALQVEEGFAEGALVTHWERGIGRFLGLVPVDVEGERRDLLELLYANDSKLLLPPEQIGALSPYRGGEKEPALSRLDTPAWKRTRTKVEEAVAEVARSLSVRKKARRKARAVPADPPSQAEMEAAFPFEETPSQLEAIARVKAGLEGTEAMDLLLCADVGYGKTEVALRACHKVAASGLQAAILAPTTLLAQQHWESCTRRMSFPVGRMWAGEPPVDESVSLVVGTHALLGADLPRLALLVVDEEQQFGVEHKDQLRKLSQHTHVLSMTATPIPRTLQLGLLGVREVIRLESPPLARRPVRTYLLEESPAILEQALARGGQAFVLHNRIAELPKLARRLERMTGAQAAVAHGQLPAGELERVMGEFAAGKQRLLVCSTVIEAGVDLPQVNTIIVLGAERFGLPQLYQIRGRVGRGERQGFCYLMVPSLAKLTAVARGRLETLCQFTQLGAGFQIAQRDLEIRGAGDLLGEDQSGHIARVGWTLYARMLAEALGTPFKPPGRVSARGHIPTEYLADTAERIAIYRRLAAGEDLLDEVRDRFGEPPQAVLDLLAKVQQP